MRKYIAPILFVVAAGAHVASADDPKDSNDTSKMKSAGSSKKTLQVKSSAFDPREAIPAEFTCEGSSTTPPLEWSTPPENAKSVAVLIEGTDAKGNKSANWLITNVPTATTSLPAGASLPDKAVEGKNDKGTTGYAALCAPAAKAGGTAQPQQVKFEVYALDKTLAPSPMGRVEFMKAINGHVVAKGELVGMLEPAKPGEKSSSREPIQNQGKGAQNPGMEDQGTPDQGTPDQGTPDQGTQNPQPQSQPLPGQSQPPQGHQPSSNPPSGTTNQQNKPQPSGNPPSGY